MNNNNNDGNNNNTKDLTTKTQTSPTISDDVIDQLIALSDDKCQWCKLVTDGFKFVDQDKIVGEIVGRIVTFQLYLIKFEPANPFPLKKPHVHDDAEIPEGYSRRCDVKLRVDGQLIGLSLAPTSIDNFSRYTTYLKNQGLRPCDVISRIHSKQKSNVQGTFNVAVFEVADFNNKMPSETPSDDKSFDFPEEWD